MLNPGPFPRQILIEAEIEPDQPDHPPLGQQVWGWPSPCPAPRQDRGLLTSPPAAGRLPAADPPLAADPPPATQGCRVDSQPEIQPASQPDREADSEAERAAGGAATAQLLRLPVHSVRFLQAMAEYGPTAQPVRIGANPPQGHVLFHSFSD